MNRPQSSARQARRLKLKRTEKGNIRPELRNDGTEKYRGSGISKPIYPGESENGYRFRGRNKTVTANRIRNAREQIYKYHLAS